MAELPNWLKEILAEPTASIMDTGRCFGVGKNKAYDAARSGKWPTVGHGVWKRVPTAFIRRQLHLDEAC